MLAFSRITSILFFVLSLSFFAFAAPTPTYDSSSVAPSHGDAFAMIGLMVDLKAKVDVHTTALANAKSIAAVTAEVDQLAANVQACAKAVAALDASVKVDAAAKEDLAIKVAAIVTVIVQACVSLVAKFGILALLTIFAKIDIALNLLLTNLNACVAGLIQLVAAIVVKLGVSVFAQVHLGLCINVLGLVGLSI